MFDGKFLGFVAVGGVLFFRSTSGIDLEVMNVPEDCDAHTLARTLNSCCNACFELVRMFSNFKF